LTDQVSIKTGVEQTTDGESPGPLVFSELYRKTGGSEGRQPAVGVWGSGAKEATSKKENPRWGKNLLANQEGRQEMKPVLKKTRGDGRDRKHFAMGPFFGPFLKSRGNCGSQEKKTIQN